MEAVKGQVYTKKAVFILLWPMIIEQALNQLVGIVNSMMVSSVGMDAISAISIVDQMNTMFIQGFAAVAAGATVVVSQAMGRRDLKGAEEASTETFSLLVLAGAAIGLVLFLFPEAILSALFQDAEASVLSYAAIYAMGSAISYPFIAAFSVCACVLRAVGDSRSPMIAAFVSNVVNIAVGYVAIIQLEMGVTGAAAAVLSSRVAYALMIYWKLRHGKGIIHLQRFTFHMTKRHIAPVMKIGIPAGLDSLVFNGGKLLVTIFMSGMGTEPLAANGIAMAIFTFMHIPGTAMSNAGITVTGRTYGAGAYEETQRYMYWIPRVSQLLLLGMCITFALLEPVLLGLYNPSELTAEISHQLMCIVYVAVPIIWPVAFILPNCLRGVGEVNFNTVVSISSMWIFRVGLGYVLGVMLGWDVVGVWTAMIVDWVARAACFMWRRKMAFWRRKALKAREEFQAQKEEPQAGA